MSLYRSFPRRDKTREQGLNIQRRGHHIRADSNCLGSLLGRCVYLWGHPLHCVVIFIPITLGKALLARILCRHRCRPRNSGVNSGIHFWHRSPLRKIARDNFQSQSLEILAILPPIMLFILVVAI